MLENIEEHYKTLSPRLMSYLIVSGSSYATACEIVQDTFLKLWKNRETIDDDASLISGLVFKMARNIRTDRYRHEKRTVLDPDAGVLESDKTDKPIDATDATYLRERINAALNALPPLLREAYTLFHLGELSVKEVAKETGVTEALVKVRIFRAKQKLQEALGDLREW